VVVVLVWELVWGNELAVEGGKFGRCDAKSVASTSTKDTLHASGRVKKDWTHRRTEDANRFEANRFVA